MTQTQAKPTQQFSPQARTQIRIDADALLRDIAFVLKMTQRMRDEMEAVEEVEEPVLV